MTTRSGSASKITFGVFHLITINARKSKGLTLPSTVFSHYYGHPQGKIFEDIGLDIHSVLRIFYQLNKNNKCVWDMTREHLDQINWFSKIVSVCMKLKTQSPIWWSHRICILCENIHIFCMLRKCDVIFPRHKALKKQMLYGWGSFRFRCKHRMHNSQLVICTQLVEYVITWGLLELVKRLQYFKVWMYNCFIHIIYVYIFFLSKHSSFS